MTENTDTPNVTELAADIVSSFVANNSVAVCDLPGLIAQVHKSLASLGAEPEAAIEDVLKPTAAQIRKSITEDALISFEDGQPYKTLKRHLTKRGLSLAEYKTKYGLPRDYPTTAPSYSAWRSEMARAAGLGRQPGEKVLPKSKAKKAAAE